MSAVIFNEIVTSNSKKLAVAELNSPQSLNALSLNMFELLLQQLLLWQADDDVAMVILQGAGNKAFCAGGDVVSLFHALKSEKGDNEATLSDLAIVESLAYDFFTKEYQLDQLIHEYTKPLLVWGDGYIMGGGIGLFAGASHRVVTENSLLAMPEITIGLYPDVGASWFLNKIPNNIGLFLGLTGATFNAVDAINIGLANIAIKSEFKDELLQCLSKVAWKSERENFKLLDEALAYFIKTSEQVFELIESNIEQHQELIGGLFESDNALNIYNALIALETDNQWLQSAQAKLKKGSPLSAMIIYHQLQTSRSYSLAKCFSLELNLSLRCCQYQEFSEGVRALLVDKDKQPQWAFNHIEDIPTELLAWFFSPIENL